MKPRWPIYPLLLAAALYGVSAQAQLKYRIQDLGTIQGGVNESVLAEAVNNTGDVVGTSIITSDASRLGSFIYEDGSIRALKSTGRWSEAYTATDLNDQGVAVGEFRDRPAGTSRPVMYRRDGAVIELGLAPSGSRNPVYVNINNAGTVVGRDDAGSFIYDGGVTRELRLEPLDQGFFVQALNDRGVTAGLSQGFNYLYDGRTATQLPRISEGPSNFDVVDLNNQNQILGQAVIYGDGSERFFQSFIYEDGRYRPLGPLGSIEESLTARAFNDDGVAVGAMRVGPSFDQLHAFVWQDGTAQDLNDLIAPDPLGNTWRLLDARDINEHGQIVGIGLLNGGGNARGFIATLVPEPGSWALMLAGMGVVAWRLRRGAPGGPSTAAA